MHGVGGTSALRAGPQNNPNSQSRGTQAGRRDGGRSTRAFARSASGRGRTNERSVIGVTNDSALNGVPERLGKYHVLGVAGRGNMGVVYTGYDPYADRDVAIKVCSLDHGSPHTSPGLARKMFFNEAHTAGVLDHPNIMKVLDAGEQDDKLYIVMEYIDGGETLAAHCHPSRLLPFKSVAEIVYTCAIALDYAHRRGVVHRDIKPTNILLPRDGVLKIGDFGIAQHTLYENTEVLGLVGSPNYMSPEQVQEETLTGQTDLYSLGVVMFELLTGTVPYQATQLTQLVNKICNEPPPSLRELRPDVPEPLQCIVSWALEKDTARRYGSGREMASDLAAVFTDLEQLPEKLTDDDKFQLVRRLRFFEEFSDTELWEVMRASTWQTHKDGERILTEGAVDLSFFIIVQGEVSVWRQERAVSALGSGDCFGEMGYAGGLVRSASIVADDDVTVMKINSALMERASIECQLRFNKAFVKLLVERLSRTREHGGAQNRLMATLATMRDGAESDRRPGPSAREAS